MSLEKFIKYLSKGSAAQKGLAESADKTARYTTLRALERSTPMDSDFKKTIEGMIPKGRRSITKADHPNAADADISDLEKAFTLKLEDNQRHREWTQLGQPGRHEMDKIAKDFEMADHISADDTEQGLRKLQKIYGYAIHRHPDFADAQIENKIPGFTDWMRKKN